MHQPTQLETGTPKMMGMCEQHWQNSVDLAERFCSSGEIPAITFQVVKQGMRTPPIHFGSARLAHEQAVNDETLFLIASLTKPLVAMAVLLLVERGQLALNERVVNILPEIKEASKRNITVRHLLTHTSGLPDMLPNNQELREQNASLDEFIKQTISTELVFSPGRGAQYQSMGYALLGPIITQVSGLPYQEFLRQKIFEPLGMDSTWLGLPDHLLASENVAEVRVPEVQRAGDHWNWNSPYWKSLGAPWGGTLSTVNDLSAFCHCMLQRGMTSNGKQLFSTASVELATTNRLHDYPLIPEADRRTRGWGCGWRMNWRDHRGAFGDLLGAEVYGHWGATGTLFWINPRTDSALVILSTQPMDREVSPLVKLSNAIVSSL